MKTDINNLSITELKRLIAHGIVELKVNSKYQGKSMEETDITKLEDFKPFKELQGVGISLSEASRKYSIPQPTISRWLASNKIPSIGVHKNRKLIDEAFIAYYAKLYKEMKGSGRRTDRLLFQ